jgi:hypothetical protein
MAMSNKEIEEWINKQMIPIPNIIRIDNQITLKEVKTNMGTLRDNAKAYSPQSTHNVAELEAVSLDTSIELRKGKDKEGKEFSYFVAVVLGEEYRVPATVLKDIKAILEAKPSLKTVKVIKKGEGMKTQYTVIPLE